MTVTTYQIIVSILRMRRPLSGGKETEATTTSPPAAAALVRRMWGKIAQKKKNRTYITRQGQQRRMRANLILEKANTPITSSIVFNWHFSTTERSRLGPAFHVVGKTSGINAIIPEPSSDHHSRIICVFSDPNHTQKHETKKQRNQAVLASRIKWFLSPSGWAGTTRPLCQMRMLSYIF